MTASAQAAATHPFLYVTNGIDNNVTMYDIGGGTTAATVPPGTQPQGALATADGKTVYIANAIGGIQVISTASNTVTGTIGVGNGPFAVAVANVPVPDTATTTTLTSSASTSTVGAPVTYTATVSPVPDGGTVALTDGTTPVSGCGSVTVSSTGTATCQVTYTSAGTHSITAAYSGDSAFAASTSAALTHRHLRHPLASPAGASSPVGAHRQPTPGTQAPAAPTAAGAFRVVLACAEGGTIGEVAAELGVSRDIVSRSNIELRGLSWGHAAR